MARYPLLTAGQRLTAAVLSELIPDKIVKAASTDRAATTTLADDPELQGLTLAAGTYEIHVLLLATSLSSAPDIKTTWEFTGTWTVPVRALNGPGTTATGGATANTEWRADGQAANSAAAYALAATSDYSVIREEAHDVVVTVAGDLSVQWAQQTSDGTATSVKPGSYLSARRIA